MTSQLEFAFIPVAMSVPRNNGSVTRFVMPAGDHWSKLGEPNRVRHERGDGVMWLNPAWASGMSCKYLKSTNVDNLQGMAVYGHIHLAYPSVIIRPAPMLPGPVLTIEAVIKQSSMKVDVTCTYLSGNVAYHKVLPGLPVLTVKQLGSLVLVHLQQQGLASVNSQLNFVRAGGTDRLASVSKAWKWPAAQSSTPRVRSTASSSSSTTNTIKNYFKKK